MAEPKEKVPQSPDTETLGTEHEGAPSQVKDVNPKENPAEQLGKFDVLLRVVEDPKVNNEVNPPITKYHLSQETIAYFTIDGKEHATKQARSLWLKLIGDNPLDKEKDDTLILNKKDTRLTKSSWLSDPDDPDSEMYYTHWINPKVFTMQPGHEPAEW